MGSLPVSVDDAVHRPVRPLLQQVIHVSLKGFTLLAAPGGEGGAARQILQQSFPSGGTLVDRFLGGGTADARPQLVIEVQEQLAVPGVLGQPDQVGHVPHHPVGEKAAVHLAAAVGGTGALQQVHEGEGAVIVPIEHSRLLVAGLGHLGQILILPLPVVYLHLSEGGAVAPGGVHGLGAALGVEPDEAVGCCHDLAGGAVVLFQQQHPGAGIGVLKGVEGLGAGRPEAVNALVLVSHHEELDLLPRQQADDGVLDLGGVLGLVHAQIGVSPPPLLENLGIAPQNLIGVAQLIIVVHEPPLPQGLVVGLVDGREVDAVDVHAVQVGPAGQAVFYIGDGGLDGLDGGLRGVLLGEIAADLPDKGGLPSGVLQQIKGLLVHQLLAPADDGGAHPVDGAEGQPLRQLRPEEGGKAPAHIPGGGDGVGHGEDAPGVHPQPQHQVADAADQHGGLAAAGHRQQQHRAVHGLNGGLLLLVQAQAVGLFELIEGHSTFS